VVAEFLFKEIIEEVFRGIGSLWTNNQKQVNEIL